MQKRPNTRAHNSNEQPVNESDIFQTSDILNQSRNFSVKQSSQAKSIPTHASRRKRIRRRSKTGAKQSVKEEPSDDDSEYRVSSEEEDDNDVKDEFFSSNGLRHNSSTSSNRVRLVPKRHCNATEFLADSAILREIEWVVDTFRHEL